MSIAYRKSLQSDTDLNIPIFCAASIHSALLTAQQRIYIFFTLYGAVKEHYPFIL